jgi:hypothetical protein
VAIQATIETDYGESRSLYIRINSVEVSNHGLASSALVRGYLSQDAFAAGKPYVWEREVQFTPDVSQPVWPQAYSVLKQALQDSTDSLEARLSGTISDLSD